MRPLLFIIILLSLISPIPAREKTEYSATNKIFYQKGNEIICYDIKNKKKNIILSNKNLIEFNLSPDGTLLAYTLKEASFEGNSDIFIKDLKGDKTIQLTPKDASASLDPHLSPDNQKVYYVSRDYDPKTKRLSAGEIRVIGADGKSESSRPLFAPSEIEGLEEDGFLTEAEINSVKIGIKGLSPDGKAIAFWKITNIIEGSLLPQLSVANIDKQTTYFTKHFWQQNSYSAELEMGTVEMDWPVADILWFDDNSFIVMNEAPAPLSDRAAYYFDNKQNKKWELLDSAKQQYEHYPLLKDVVKDNGNFTILYKIDGSVYINNFSLKETITDKKLLAGKLVVEKYQWHHAPVKFIKLFDSDNIIYVRENKEGSGVGVYLYDLKNKEAIKIDEHPKEISVDFIR